VELKPKKRESGYVSVDTFNRTIVELKLCSYKYANAAFFPFNRTIVELKRVISVSAFIVLKPFNRTIVELKQK